MTKYHINKRGVPALCRATKGKCPFGDSDSHYDSIEQAQKASDKMNSEEFGVVSSLPKKKEFSQTDKDVWTSRNGSVQIVRITNKDGIDLENASFRIDVDGKTVDTMVKGFTKAKRLARKVK